MSQQAALDPTTLKKLQGVVPALVEAFRQDPQAAQARFEAKTRVVHGFETEVTGRGFRLTIDEPESLGGTNKGFNPVEVLLGTLGTCQEIVLVAYAAALGIELDKVEIKVSGEIDLRGLFNVAPVEPGFQSIHFDAVIEAKNATEEQLAQLKALGLGHCPVLDTLLRAVPVTSTYTLKTNRAAA
ncbi:MAG TPA: OsmC family protein [bacterium]|nr:OsmC family protein [bacterium]